MSGGMDVQRNSFALLQKKCFSGTGRLKKTESNSSNNSSKPSGSNNTASNENNGGNNNVPAPPVGSGSSPVFSMSDFPTEESFNAYREQNIHKWILVDEFGNELGKKSGKGKETKQ